MGINYGLALKIKNYFWLYVQPFPSLFLMCRQLKTAHALLLSFFYFFLIAFLLIIFLTWNCLDSLNMSKKTKKRDIHVDTIISFMKCKVTIVIEYYANESRWNFIQKRSTRSKCVAYFKLKRVWRGKLEENSDILSVRDKTH